MYTRILKYLLGETNLMYLPTDPRSHMVNLNVLRDWLKIHEEGGILPPETIKMGDTTSHFPVCIIENLHFIKEKQGKRYKFLKMFTLTRCKNMKPSFGRIYTIDLFVTGPASAFDFLQHEWK